MLVVVHYFTIWIESEPLAKITVTQVLGFIWKSIVYRFGIPNTIITDNDQQFTEQKFEDFLKELGIHHVTSSVEHSQTNGQAEVANKIVLTQLKKRLGPMKGRWTEELLKVLWASRCTPHTMMGEFPFNLTYKKNAMLPIKVDEPSLRRQLQKWSINEEYLKIELDLLDELRDKARIREVALKQRLARRYNAKVRSRKICQNDLVWQMRGGPLRIREVLHNDTRGWSLVWWDNNRHKRHLLYWG